MKSADQMWGTCRCGKVYPSGFTPRTNDTARTRELMQRLSDGSLCQACGTEMLKALDLCPEHMTTEHGVSACSREWHHEGRCEPYPEPTPEMVEQLRRSS